MKYFLDRDSDSHWYLIEEVHREDWRHWLDLDSDDEESWDVPDYANRLPGDPAMVVFENPSGYEWPPIPQYQP